MGEPAAPKKSPCRVHTDCGTSALPPILSPVWDPERKARQAINLLSSLRSPSHYVPRFRQSNPQERAVCRWLLVSKRNNTTFAKTNIRLLPQPDDWTRLMLPHRHVNSQSEVDVDTDSFQANGSCVHNTHPPTQKDFLSKPWRNLTKDDDDGRGQQKTHQAT